MVEREALPAELVLRATLNGLRTSGQAVACRECGLEWAACEEHYHPKQLKEWAKRDCQPPAPLCLACAQHTKEHELRRPVGVCVDPRTGAPLLRQRSAPCAE